jgi:hypothetical protein
MKPLYTVALVAGGLVVVDQVVRGSFAKPVSREVERDEGHADALRSAVGAELPCDAERHDVDSTTLVQEWSQQAAGLVAKLGGILGRPKLTAACAADWLELWLDAWKEASNQDRERYRVVRDAGVALLQGPADWRPELAVLPTRNVPRSAIGKVWDDLRALHAAAELEGDAPGVWVRAPEVAAALRDFAVVLDAAGAAADEPSGFLEFLKRGNENRRKAFRMVGELLGVVVEGAVTPVADSALSATISTLASAAAPYLIIGGLGYLAWRTWS